MLGSLERVPLDFRAAVGHKISGLGPDLAHFIPVDGLLRRGPLFSILVDRLISAIIMRVTVSWGLRKA